MSSPDVVIEVPQPVVLVLAAMGISDQRSFSIMEFGLLLIRLQPCFFFRNYRHHMNFSNQAKTEKEVALILTWVWMLVSRNQDLRNEDAVVDLLYGTNVFRIEWHKGVMQSPSLHESV